MINLVIGMENFGDFNSSLYPVGQIATIYWFFAIASYLIFQVSFFTLVVHSDDVKLLKRQRNIKLFSDLSICMFIGLCEFWYKPALKVFFAENEHLSEVTRMFVYKIPSGTFTLAALALFFCANVFMRGKKNGILLGFVLSLFGFCILVFTPILIGLELIK